MAHFMYLRMTNNSFLKLDTPRRALMPNVNQNFLELCEEETIITVKNRTIFLQEFHHQPLKRLISRTSNNKKISHILMQSKKKKNIKKLQMHKICSKLP